MNRLSTARTRPLSSGLSPGPRMGIMAGLGLLASVLLGCPRAPADPVTPSANASEPGPESSPEPSPEPAQCGRPNQRFADYGWIPDDSRLTAAVAREDPELPTALERLAALRASETLALPIHADLAFANLRLQLAGLERVLASLGMSPAELVELHGPAGEVVWVWPSDCPSAELASAALARFGVQLRLDFERPGIRTGAGSAERFPFDLIFVHERHVAVAPLGRGTAVAAWLSGPRADPEGPGPSLSDIELAPIRVVLRGPALLGDGASAPRDASPLQIRVTATGWQAGEHESSPADPGPQPDLERP
jgi:hypothetical protein